jgi:tetrahydromethanopterin S-methyltransferase subunit B
MSNQEKWNSIVERIEELGEELQEIFESLDPSTANVHVGEIEMSLYGLRITVQHLSDQDLDE